MSEEFSRRVDIHVFKDEPDTREEWLEYATVTVAEMLGEGDPEMVCEDRYRQYVGKFQPYRWHAKAANNKILSDGELYFNLTDLLETVELLFGDDTTAYWAPMFGEERGLNLLRYGKTDRDHQSGKAVSE